MIKDTKALSSFSVDELEKAKDFYGSTLSLVESNRPTTSILRRRSR